MALAVRPPSAGRPDGSLSGSPGGSRTGPRSAPAPAHPRRGCARWLAALLALTLSLQLLILPAQAGLFGEFTIADEVKMGDEFAQVIRASMPIVEDPEIKGYVQRMVARLVHQLPPQPWPIQAEVVLNPTINAFAGPAGHVYVFSGLLLAMDDPSQVAGVLAHELAHTSQRHLAQRIEQAQLLTPLAILGMLAGAFLGGKAGGALALGTQAAATSAMLSYSRDDEREADQVGMNYLVGAGYNPEGLLGGFQVLSRRQWSRTGDIPNYNTTHPGLQERIGYLGDRIRRMPPEYLSRQDDKLAFQRMQTILRARYTDPETALAHFESKNDKDDPCLASLGKAIVLDRLNRVSEAKTAFTTAMKCAPSDALAAREAGRFYFERGDFAAAAPLLARAVMTSPNDAMALFFYARLLSQTGEQTKAIDYMQRVAKKVPEDSEVHYFLGRFYGEDGDYFNGHLQLAYAGLYANNETQATFQLDQARRYAKTQADKDAITSFEDALGKRREFW